MYFKSRVGVGKFIKYHEVKEEIVSELIETFTAPLSTGEYDTTEEVLNSLAFCTDNGTYVGTGDYSAEDIKDSYVAACNWIEKNYTPDNASQINYVQATQDAIASVKPLSERLHDEIVSNLERDGLTPTPEIVQAAIDTKISDLNTAGGDAIAEGRKTEAAEIDETINALEEAGRNAGTWDGSTHSNVFTDEYNGVSTSKIAELADLTNVKIGSEEEALLADTGSIKNGVKVGEGYISASNAEALLEYSDAADTLGVDPKSKPPLFINDHTSYEDIVHYYNIEGYEDKEMAGLDAIKIGNKYYSQSQLDIRLDDAKHYYECGKVLENDYNGNIDFYSRYQSNINKTDMVLLNGKYVSRDTLKNDILENGIVGFDKITDAQKYLKKNPGSGDGLVIIDGKYYIKSQLATTVPKYSMIDEKSFDERAAQLNNINAININKDSFDAGRACLKDLNHMLENITPDRINGLSMPAGTQFIDYSFGQTTRDTTNNLNSFLNFSNQELNLANDLTESIRTILYGTIDNHDSYANASAALFEEPDNEEEERILEETLEAEQQNDFSANIGDASVNDDDVVSSELVQDNLFANKQTSDSNSSNNNSGGTPSLVTAGFNFNGKKVDESVDVAGNKNEPHLVMSGGIANLFGTDMNALLDSKVASGLRKSNKNLYGVLAGGSMILAGGALLASGAMKTNKKEEDGDAPLTVEDMLKNETDNIVEENKENISRVLFTNVAIGGLVGGLVAKLRKKDEKDKGGA